MGSITFVPAIDENKQSSNQRQISKHRLDRLYIYFSPPRKDKCYNLSTDIQRFFVLFLQTNNTNSRDQMESISTEIFSATRTSADIPSTKYVKNLKYAISAQNVPAGSDNSIITNRR